MEPARIGETALLIGGALSGVAALLHLGCIAGGAPWYRFFGAGETMARAAERGALRPTIVTLGIAAVLAVWAAYAFSGAGVLPRLPLLKAGLVAITAVYLARGLAFPVLMRTMPGQSLGFWLWSSGIVLAFGLVHAVGTALSWSRL